MSPSPEPRPWPPSSPPPGPGPGASKPRPARRPGPGGPAPWGWIEWYVVASQVLLPALLFIPGVSVLRLLNRCSSFALGLMAWFGAVRKPRRPPTTLRATLWLKICIGWLVVSIFHPSTNSPLAAVATVALYVTVMSPAFWAPTTLVSVVQVRRLVLLIFGASALGAALGLAQVFLPRVFNPPYIPIMAGGDPRLIGAATYQAFGGRTIVRPCGLGDVPGGACVAGCNACVLGLCLALSRAPIHRRLIGAGMALVGLATVYVSQVRTALVMILIGVAALAALFLARREVRRALLLIGGMGAMLVAAATWVVGRMGGAAIERFLTLYQQRAGTLYQGSRGFLLEHTFTHLLPEYPLGAGLARYGQMYEYFGDKGPAAPPSIWAEIQWTGWVLDGGVPLMVAYAIAIGLGLADSVRIALRSRDPEIGHWASAICAVNLGIVATCFSAIPFQAASGMTFWLLTATLHEADRRQGAAARPTRPARPGPRPGPAPGPRPA